MFFFVYSYRLHLGNLVDDLLEFLACLGATTVEAVGHDGEAYELALAGGQIAGITTYVGHRTALDTEVDIRRKIGEHIAHGSTLANLAQRHGEIIIDRHLGNLGKETAYEIGSNAIES